MAYIEKRKSGYRVQVRRRGAPSLSRTFDLKADAESWGREMERELQRGNVEALRNDASRITVEAIAERFEVSELPKRRSASARMYFNAARKRFGAYALGNVRSVDVAKWRDDLLDSGLSAQSVIHYLNSLSSLFTYATRELSIPLPAGHPVRSIRKPTLPPPRDRRLQAGEFEALLRSARQPGAATGLPEIIILAVETSARLSELLALRWKDIDLDERIAVVRGAHGEQTKNGDPYRIVALSQAAVTALRALPRRIDGQVFTWKTVSGFESIWRRCLARARRQHAKELEASKRKPEPDFLADLRFHDLRHEATSRLFEKDLGIMEVASMTGHKSLAMLKRYTHVEAKRLAAKLG